MKLWRAAGRFTKQLGTDQVVHFNRISTDDVRETTELYEVLQFRKLRRAIVEGTVTDIQSRGASLYLMLGSVLSKLCWRDGADPPRLVLAHAELAPELEAIKLLRQTALNTPLSVEAHCPNRDVGQKFLALHGRFDRIESAVRISSIRIAALDEVFPVADDRSLIFLDLFKSRGDDIWRCLNRQFDGGYGASVLAVFRGSQQSGATIWDVANRNYELPALDDVATWCESRGLFASYTYLEDFDREFLLPFDGTYGVIMLHVTPDPERQFADLGFLPLRSFQPAQRQDLVLNQVGPRARNYDSLFNEAVPLTDAYQEPDWSHWKRARDWDPAEVEFKSGAFPGDPLVNLFQTPTLAARDLARQVIAISGPAAPLSIAGLAHAAYILHDKHALLSLKCLLRALAACGDRRDAEQILFSTLNLIPRREATPPDTPDISDRLPGGSIGRLLGEWLDKDWLPPNTPENDVLAAIRDGLIGDPALAAEAEYSMRTLLRMRQS